GEVPHAVFRRAAPARGVRDESPATPAASIHGPAGRRLLGRVGPRPLRPARPGRGPARREWSGPGDRLGLGELGPGSRLRPRSGRRGAGMRYLPRVLRYLRPHWRLAAVSVALIGLGAAVGLLVPWPLKILVDNVLQGQPLPPRLAWAAGRTAENRPALLVVVV